MDLSMAPPREAVNEQGQRAVPDPGREAPLRSGETVGYINWLELASIRLYERRP